MTTASKGLAAALGRSASGAVIALAEMSADELLAGLTDGQKASIAASLAASATAKDMKPQGDNCSEDGDEDDSEGDADPSEEDGQSSPSGKKKAAASASAASATTGLQGSDRVKAVAHAVATDDNCKGKADLALAMLADDDFAGLSASGIVKLLGKTPANAAASTSAGGDPESAARAEMRAAIAETTNADIDAGSGAGRGGSNQASVSAIWDRAIQANNPGLSLS